MQKVHSAVSVVVAGKRFDFEQALVEEALKAVTPEPLRDHFVVVAGRRFPPKQAMGVITGLDRAEFTTYQSRSILRRLGFATGRARPHRESLPGSQKSPSPEVAGEADKLRPYMGRWVAAKDNEVIAEADSPQEIVAWLRRHNRTADETFRVPLDPASDIGALDW